MTSGATRKYDIYLSKDQRSWKYRGSNTHCATRYDMDCTDGYLANWFKKVVRKLLQNADPSISPNVRR